MSNRILLVFLDPIEACSYPVTESGYALLHRLWHRCGRTQDTIYVAYPHDHITMHSGHLVIKARPLIDFSPSPYHYYQEQRSEYDSHRDLGSQACHVEGAPVDLLLSQVNAILWRQELGDPYLQREKLMAIASLRESTLLFLDPALLLSPEFSSKALPNLLAPQCVPVSFCTRTVDGSIADKAEAALDFVQHRLGDPQTTILKPFSGDNGLGITFLGQDPRHVLDPPLKSFSKIRVITELLQQHQDIIVQEYIPSIRAPANGIATPTQFGEVRFLLIDGQIPTRNDGKPLIFAHRSPTPNSLMADSGISQPTYLTSQEMLFLEDIGKSYRQMGIHFGGGDLIRTPDPERPFVFTDAARAVCGHLVVTGALNNQPYLIVDQVLDCFERCFSRHQSHQSVRMQPTTPAQPLTQESLMAETSAQPLSIPSL
ncbi:MAG: hypothetical protein KTR25_12240 [Myxococcales bacterium]|nr:hypothetical protein [Myxococcales bacterium]